MSKTEQEARIRDASPELLEACKTMLNGYRNLVAQYLPTSDEREFIYSFFREGIPLANDAIAKAERKI